MIKIFTYLDEGCDLCKYVVGNMKKVENWENYFEIVDICVDSSTESKTESQTQFSAEALKYGITECPCVVIDDSNNEVQIIMAAETDMNTEYFESLIQ